MKAKSQPENVTPCRYMEKLLHSAADGKLRGLAKWYAWSHAKRCKGCLAFLRRIEAASLALRAARAGSVSEEQLDRLRAQVKALSKDETTSEFEKD